MNRIELPFAACLCWLALVSCAKYDIRGTSDISDVDGRMLYLKEAADGGVRNLDSCDVVHGKFKFCGGLDSVRVVMLCLDDRPLLPVVLEDGDISVTLNGQNQQCTGTALNDTLDNFNRRYRQLSLAISDLESQQSRAIMDGEDLAETNARLNAEGRRLMEREDKMVTDFITANFDNCLGPYVFQMATNNFDIPMLTPWIEALMTTATEAFKNDAYVKEYMEKAKYNQDIMTGVIDAPKSDTVSARTDETVK